MKHWYMLTVVGNDRTGIVARLTETLYRNGCNLGEASMARLGGSFSIMLMVQTDADSEALRAHVAPLARELGLHVHLDRIEAQLHKHVEPNLRVTVSGADRAGIVAEVTGALASAGFNILDLYSDVAGTLDKPIYVMIIDGFAPDSGAALEAALAPVRQRGVDLHLTPLDTLIG